MLFDAKAYMRVGGTVGLAIGLMFVGLRCGAEVPDVDRVPGAVIDHQPSPSLSDRVLGKAQYVGTPSIAILPSGVYVATHDLFGRGSSEDVSGVTKVFRSTDRGANWTHAATLDGQFWSTVFVHRGALFVFGFTAKGGDIVIRRSDDGGDTWTTPVDAESGVLRKGRYGGTSNRPVAFEGRLWIAQSSRLMSAREDADLLRADSWIIAKPIAQDENWLGGRFKFWSEGQVVASPSEGVVVLPKVKQLPYTALVRADTPQSLRFDASRNFVELPGGEKKFGAAYDAISGRFYICSNPVLPAHKNDGQLRDKQDMIRNTAALLSSKDLYHWNVEKIFLYSPDIHHEAFQYLNFEFDGDDLAVISRTAFDVGGYPPPRGHDSNLLTFHRIPNFRNASPDHELTIDRGGNRVLRYERTQYERAPLGTFALGTRFDGAALNEPVELVQDDDGQVYILEREGRILQFDAAGNFLSQVDSAPLPFEGGRVSVRQPPAGEQSWTGLSSWAWEEPTNWYYWGRPDTAEEIAIFGSASSVSATITLDRAFQIKGMRFRNAASYTVAGGGELAVGSADSGGVFEALQGEHRVQVPVRLDGPARVYVASGAGLNFERALDLNGEALDVIGAGALTVSGSFSMGKGRLVLRAGNPIVFGDASRVQLDGTLELRLPDGSAVTSGDRFEVLDFTPPLRSTFDEVALPELSDGLSWNTSMLYITGIVEAVAAR